MAEKHNEVIADYNACNQICPMWKGINETKQVIDYGR